jgi:hypothetical protein
VEPSPALLKQCRDSLAARLEAEPAPVASSKPGFWEQLASVFTIPNGLMRPAGAVAMLAAGFFGARLIPPSDGIGMRAGMDPGASRVRYVEPAENGRVQIVLDETTQHVITGRLEDENIRALLLAATRDPSDSGLRAQTVGILTGGAQAADVRDALLWAVRNDQNAGVRLKAIGGLKSFVREPEVRSTLAEIVLTDTNPGMRTEAVNLLTQSLNESEDAMDRQTIGVLQEIMSRADNDYVRQQVQRTLELVNASAEIY